MFQSYLEHQLIFKRKKERKKEKERKERKGKERKEPVNFGRGYGDEKIRSQGTRGIKSRFRWA
jgi:hypothetical protein